MAKNCPAACNNCRQRITAVINPRSKTECSDKQLQCKTWATYRLCTLKPTYMALNCAKSCGEQI